MFHSWVHSAQHTDTTNFGSRSAGGLIVVGCLTVWAWWMRKGPFTQRRLQYEQYTEDKVSISPREVKKSSALSFHSCSLEHLSMFYFCCQVQKGSRRIKPFLVIWAICAQVSLGAIPPSSCSKQVGRCNIKGTKELCVFTFYWLIPFLIIQARGSKQPRWSNGCREEGSNRWVSRRYLQQRY